KPSTVAGGFSVQVKIGDKSVQAEFLVGEEKRKALLTQTSIDLGILMIQNPA
ncbi:hypothetical protein ACJMK2_039325, partial [Sinanodonta woodiana]